MCIKANQVVLFLHISLQYSICRVTMNGPFLACYFFTLALLVPCCKCRKTYDYAADGENYKELNDAPKTLQKMQESIIALQTKVDSSIIAMNTLHKELDQQKSKCSADVQVLKDQIAEQTIYYNTEMNNLKAHIASVSKGIKGMGQDFKIQTRRRSQRSVSQSDASRESENGNTEQNKTESQLDFQQQFIQSNFETIQAMKTEVERHKKEIAMLKTGKEIQANAASINHQQNLIQENKDKLETIKDVVTEQDNQINFLQNGHDKLLIQVDQQEGNISALFEVTGRNTRKISELESQSTSSQLLTANTPTIAGISSRGIAFRASLSTTVNAFHGMKVRFNKIDINLGAGYNTTGDYTCTVPGIYVFHQSLRIGQIGKMMMISMKKNGQVIAWNSAAFKDVHPDSGTTTAVTHLEVGDKVWIEIYTSSPGTKLEHYTTFSGYLLFPDE